MPVMEELSERWVINQLEYQIITAFVIENFLTVITFLNTQHIKPSVIVSQIRHDLVFLPFKKEIDCYIVCDLKCHIWIQAADSSTEFVLQISTEVTGSQHFWTCLCGSGMSHCAFPKALFKLRANQISLWHSIFKTDGLHYYLKEVGLDLCFQASPTYLHGLLW